MSRQTKTWIIVLVCGLIVVAGFIIFMARLMGQASTGTVQVGQPENTKNPAPIPPLPVDTRYFSTNIPGIFSIKSRTEKPNPPFLFQMDANTPAAEDERIGITVGSMPADGMAGIGDYHLREAKPDTYQKTAVKNLPAGAIAYKSISGPAALAVFWPHGSTYAELAFSTSSGATYAQLVTVYNELNTGWSWK